MLWKMLKVFCKTVRKIQWVTKPKCCGWKYVTFPSLKCHSELIHNTVSFTVKCTWEKREVMSRKGYFNFEFYQGQSDIMNFLCFRVICYFFFCYDCDGFPAVIASLTRESSLYNKDTVDSCQSFHWHKNLFRLLIGFWTWNKSFFFQPSLSNLSVLYHRKMGES